MVLTEQTARQPVQEEDEVSRIIAGLHDVLTPRNGESLEDLLSVIERRSRELLGTVPPNKRDPLAVAAAAVYHVFMQLRRKTEARMTFHMLGSLTGVKSSSIGRAWSRYFDRSVDLRRDRLELMPVNDAMGLADMIHLAVTHLRRAVDPTTPAITGWFTRAEQKAHALAGALNIPEGVLPEVAALAIIYEASHRLDGPRLVNLTYGDTMEVCGRSGAFVGKVRNTLFPDKGE
jgi:hypothetical protein